jgi:hypothetical protein
MSDVESDHEAPPELHEQRRQCAPAESPQFEVALPTNYVDTAFSDDPGEGAGTGAANASDDDEMHDDEHDGSGPPFYMTLGVSVDASTDEIRRAYYRQARIWHPDKNGHRLVEATEQFKLIGEAFETLFDPGKRAEYDFEMNVTAGQSDADEPKANVPSDSDCDMQAQREESDEMETANEPDGFSDQEDPFGHGGGHVYEDWSDAHNHCDICNDGNCGVTAHIAARKAQFDLRQAAPVSPAVVESFPVSEQDPSDDVDIGGSTEGVTGHEHVSDTLVNGYGSSGQREVNSGIVCPKSLVGIVFDLGVRKSVFDNDSGFSVSFCFLPFSPIAFLFLLFPPFYSSIFFNFLF